ncbi:zinc-binding dehydrogenase [Streptomyces sp. 7R007]
MCSRRLPDRAAVPIDAVYPLEQVQDAYRHVQRRHTRGKIVLSLVPKAERVATARALRRKGAPSAH